MEHSDSIKEIAAALVAFQTAVGPVAKTKTAKIIGKNKAGERYEYEYHYADLSDQREHVREALGKHGLYVSQDVASDGSQVAIQSMVAHTSGEWIKTGWLTIDSDGSAQAVGSAATYGRRYQYAGVLGLAAEEDDDGRTATERSATKESAPKQSVPQHDPDDPGSYVVAFGKKHNGETILEIDKADHGYVVWLAGLDDGKPATLAARAYLALDSKPVTEADFEVPADTDDGIPF